MLQRLSQSALSIDCSEFSVMPLHLGKAGVKWTVIRRIEFYINLGILEYIGMTTVSVVQDHVCRFFFSQVSEWYSSKVLGGGGRESSSHCLLILNFRHFAPLLQQQYIILTTSSISRLDGKMLSQKKNAFPGILKYFSSCLEDSADVECWLISFQKWTTKWFI